MRWLIAALLLLALNPSGTWGEELEPRHVIALVEGTTPGRVYEDAVQAQIEMPLNHLGMVVRRHMIGNGPPPVEWFDGARAVLTYFEGEKVPDWLFDWFEKEVVPRDLRIIIFGEIGPFVRASESRTVRLLERFGLFYDSWYVDGPMGIEVKFFDEKSCAYESDPRFFTDHRGPRSVSKRNTPWITTTAGDDVRHPVVTGPWGGIALEPWTLQQGTEDQDRRWHLDQFRFFRDALGLERVPAAHPCVLNGRRMWFLQVDGDGFESLSTVEPGWAANTMLDHVFNKYQLPYTVSIIVRSLTPDLKIEKPTRKMLLAREILNLPHVEAASHGVLHTSKWQQDFKQGMPPRYFKWYPSLKNYTYGQVNEVHDSITFINERLMEDGKKCDVMLWTGMSNPREDAIRASRLLGSLNVNGGVFRWDSWQDSVGFVSPWGREVGKELQVYAGAANENDFEGFYDTMPSAFAHIDTTIERCGKGRILKPANIYCHFYSCERPPRLKALQGLIERWALTEPTAPVFASTYAKAVISAVRTAKTYRTETGWRFQDYGDCRTVRIDDEPRNIDYDRSTGVLGAHRIDRSLYIHLSANDAEVVLAKNPPRHPHIEEANCLLDSAELTKTSVAVVATAHNPRRLVFAGFAPDARLTVTVGTKQLQKQAGKNGKLRLRLKNPGTTRVVVTAR